MIKSLLLSFCFFVGGINAQGQQQQTNNMKILVHIKQGPEDPTRAALAFLVAKTAIEEGHTVNLFLAGDAVRLFTSEVMDVLTGTGTGQVCFHSGHKFNWGSGRHRAYESFP